MWQIATDIEHAENVLGAVQRIERLDSGSAFGVGTRWRETRKMFGREATEEMTVIAVDEGRSYTTGAHSRGSRYSSVVSVEPVGDQRSRISMVFGAEPQGWAARMSAMTLGRLFAGYIRRALRADLDDIARAAESRTSRSA